MAHFTTSGKRYREGTDFDAFGGVDLVPVSGVPFTQVAPTALPDVEGQPPRRFLFWDTGRRLTTIRAVRWTFNNTANWAEWNAKAWYGQPGGGPPQPDVGFDAFWVGAGALDPTPIDGPGSTFVNGPNAGDIAWPYQNNDHDVHTAWGAATVRALDHLRRAVTDPQLDFSSLQTLEWGGTNDGAIFDENDDGIPAGSSGPTGIAATTMQQLTFAQNAGASVLAGYVVPVASRPVFLHDLVALVKNLHILPDVGDPSPDDIVRLKLIAESLDLVRGEGPTEIDAFEGLVGAAQLMDAAELKRTIAGTQATLRRGEAALKSMQALAEKQNR